MFSVDLNTVILIEKTKPDWQRGKLNGVGGKIEDGETPVEAMVREFEEEAGLKTWPENWRHVATIKENLASVMVFTCISGDYGRVKPMTEESIVGLDPFYVPRRNIVPNLRWIVPMCEWVLRKNKPHLAIDMHGGLA